MAENENKDLNKPNQNQSGNSNAQNGNRAPRRRPAPRRNAKPAAEGETQAANAAPRKPRDRQGFFFDVLDGGPSVSQGASPAPEAEEGAAE